MSTGEHSHAGLSGLDQHLIDCSDAAGHQYGEDYVHKHFAECLEDDPNAVMFEDPEGVNVKAFKIWMTILFLVLCVIGIIPKAWPTCSRNENVLSMLNCFSSGIF